MNDVVGRISYDVELFPNQDSVSLPFNELFAAHGVEVCGKAFDINYKRYCRIQDEGRLVWVVARLRKWPVGYSCHFVYSDLHYKSEIAASDDIWFVRADLRGRGIGGILKKMGHDRLIALGAKRTSDVIRSAFNHPHLMSDIGFERKGVKWTIDF